MSGSRRFTINYDLYKDRYDTFEADLYDEAGVPTKAFVDKFLHVQSWVAGGCVTSEPEHLEPQDYHTIVETLPHFHWGKTTIGECQDTGCEIAVQQVHKWSLHHPSIQKGVCNSEQLGEQIGLAMFIFVHHEWELVKEEIKTDHKFYTARQRQIHEVLRPVLLEITGEANPSLDMLAMKGFMIALLKKFGIADWRV